MVLKATANPFSQKKSKNLHIFFEFFRIHMLCDPPPPLQTPQNFPTPTCTRPGPIYIFIVLPPSGSPFHVFIGVVREDRQFSSEPQHPPWCRHIDVFWRLQIVRPAGKPARSPCAVPLFLLLLDPVQCVALSAPRSGRTLPVVSIRQQPRCQEGFA